MARLRGMKQLQNQRRRASIREKQRNERPFSKDISADEPFLPQVLSLPFDFKRPRTIFLNDNDLFNHCQTYCCKLFLAVSPKGTRAI